MDITWTFYLIFCMHLLDFHLTLFKTITFRFFCHFKIITKGYWNYNKFSNVFIWTFRLRLRTFIPGSQPTKIGPIIIYERCQKIPHAPKGMIWPEEQFLKDPEVKKVTDLVDPTMSRVWLEGSTSVKVGDTLKVKVVLYDGHGNRRTAGGDLVILAIISMCKTTYKNNY